MDRLTNNDILQIDINLEREVEVLVWNGSSKTLAYRDLRDRYAHWALNATAYARYDSNLEPAGHRDMSENLRVYRSRAAIAYHELMDERLLIGEERWND